MKSLSDQEPSGWIIALSLTLTTGKIWSFSKTHGFCITAGRDCGWEQNFAALPKVPTFAFCGKETFLTCALINLRLGYRNMFYLGWLWRLFTNCNKYRVQQPTCWWVGVISAALHRCSISCQYVSNYNSKWWLDPPSLHPCNPVGPLSAKRICSS